MNHFVSGDRQLKLRCLLTLALVRAVENLSHLSPITSRALLAMVGVSGLEELHLLFTPVLLCACLSLNVSFVWGQPSC